MTPNLHPEVVKDRRERALPGAKASGDKYRGTEFAKRRACKAIQARWTAYYDNLTRIYGNDALRRPGERKHGYRKRLKALIEPYQ